MTFKLPELPYKKEALEPHIDAKTMDIHYSKHHQGYTNNLNAAIEGKDLESKSIEDICKVAGASGPAVRNNGGGFYNHCLFWSIMGPNKGGTPSGDIAEAIDDAFGSFDGFKDLFSKAAATRFGSGWAWLSVGADGRLFVSSTPNQDNPLMDVAEQKGTPILGLDVWEHAYYLNYQNRRPDYINAFFSVINWDAVADNYKAAKG